MINKLLDAGKDYGWLLALALAFAALVLAWLALNPVEEAANRIGAPIAQSIGLVHERCPGGWTDVSATGDHTRVLSCERDGWLVILNGDGTFSHGLQLDTPGAEFVIEPEGIPGWPE